MYVHHPLCAWAKFFVHRIGLVFSLFTGNSGQWNPVHLTPSIDILYLWILFSQLLVYWILITFANRSTEKGTESLS